MNATPQRRYPPAKYERHEGAPLPPTRLAQIWASLLEQERLGFLHSLDESIAESVLGACVKVAGPPSSA
jgi:hypothetical protein